MQCKAGHHIWYDFWYSSKNSKKLSQNPNFLAFLQWFIDHACLPPTDRASIFFQMKGLIVIHSPGKFHEDSICGFKVIKFQMFLWRCSSHEMGPFGGFLGPFFPKYGCNLLKFGPEVFHHNTKTECEQCFTIRCLSTNGTYPKFTVFVNFWAQFTSRKMEILPKTKLFSETTSLGLSDEASCKSQVNRRILIKIITQNPFLGPKMGLNCPLGTAQGVDINFHTACNRTIHP